MDVWLDLENEFKCWQKRERIGSLMGQGTGQSLRPADNCSYMSLPGWRGWNKWCTWPRLTSRTTVWQKKKKKTLLASKSEVSFQQSHCKLWILVPEDYFLRRVTTGIVAPYSGYLQKSLLSFQAGLAKGIHCHVTCTGLKKLFPTSLRCEKGSITTSAKRLISLLEMNPPSEEELWDSPDCGCTIQGILVILYLGVFTFLH